MIRSPTPVAHTDLSDLKFSPKNVSFGRAQGFPLRMGWLPKFCNTVKNKEISLSDDELIAQWGVGKNMVASIKHWAKATDVIDITNNDAKLGFLGRYLFGENSVDPYMEDDATLWLLHWNISFRSHFFTAGYWFFNKFHNSEFLADEVAHAFVKQMNMLDISLKNDTAKRDIDVLLRMYACRNKNHDEESLETPFPCLDLIIYDNSTKQYHSEPGGKDTLPSGVIGFAAAQLFQATGLRAMPVRGAFSPDGYATLEYTFRLDEESLLEKLDTFCSQMPIFQLRQSAGVWQLFLTSELPLMKRILDNIYSL